MRITVRLRCKEHLFLLQEEIHCQMFARSYVWMSLVVGMDCVKATFSIVVRRVNGSKNRKSKSRRISSIH